MSKKFLGRALVVAAAVALVGCGSSDKGEEEALEQKVHKLSGQLAAIRSSEKQVVSKAKAAKMKTEGQRNAILDKAEIEAKKIVGHAKAEEEELGDIEDEISSEEGRFSQVEESLSGAKEEKAKSTIPGNGTFRAEVDYIPGIYESKGGHLCYWATLNSADNFDIANNENATGPTIAEITTPYFQTQGCDTWHRIE